MRQVPTTRVEGGRGGSPGVATRTDYAPGPLQDIVVLTWVGNGSIGWKVVPDAAGAQFSHESAEHLVLPEGTDSQYVLIQKKNDTALSLAEVTRRRRGRGLAKSCGDRRA